MTGQSSVLAADVPFPPTVEDFYLPSIVPWGAHDSYWFTKITLLLWLTVAILAGGFARTRNRSAWTWFLLTFFFGPIAAFLLVVWPAREPAPAETGARR